MITLGPFQGVPSTSHRGIGERGCEGAFDRQASLRSPNIFAGHLRSQAPQLCEGRRAEAVIFLKIFHLSALFLYSYGPILSPSPALQ